MGVVMGRSAAASRRARSNPRVPSLPLSRLDLGSLGADQWCWPSRGRLQSQVWDVLQAVRPMHVCPLQTLHQNMQALFSTLAEAEEQQPYLQDAAVQRGARCLAEYHLGTYGRAWNRYVPGRGGRPKAGQCERGRRTATPSLLLPRDSGFFLAASSPKICDCDHSSPRGRGERRKLCSVTLDL